MHKNLAIAMPSETICMNAEIPVEILKRVRNKYVDRYCCKLIEFRIGEEVVIVDTSDFRKNIFCKSYRNGTFIY